MVSNDMGIGWYEVHVSNVGRVLEGRNAFKANSAYHTYVRMSERGYGRCAGEDVTLIRDGEIVKEHVGDDRRRSKPRRFYAKGLS